MWEFLVMGFGRGVGRGSLEILKRCGWMLFFFVNMVGLLFVLFGFLFVFILDIFVVFFVFICCRLCFFF